MKPLAACLGAVAAVLVLATAGQAQHGPLTPLDRWQSWPVAPIFEQHPVRGGFLDPRPGTHAVGVYHTGVDISVRDDRPEPGHPPNRTHRVYAIQGGAVSLPSDEPARTCLARLVRIGHFTYSHVDPLGTVQADEHVVPGQMIGWSCYHHWHVHLSEIRTVGGQQVYVNPLRPGGDLGPYSDTAPPVVHAVRFTSPAPASWQVQNGALFSFAPAPKMRASALHDVVDPEAWVGDPQSFTGWMRGRLEKLRTEISPYELKVTLRHHLGKAIWSRVVLQADTLSPSTTPFNTLYAPGTMQSLPVYDCRTNQPIACNGRYWYHLPLGAEAPYWDTTQVANGHYDVCVTARDIVGNSAGRCSPVTVQNPPPASP